MLLIMGVGRVHLRWIYWLRQIAALSPRSEQDLAQTEQSSRSQLGNTQTGEVEEAHPTVLVDVEEGHELALTHLNL